MAPIVLTIEAETHTTAWLHMFGEVIEEKFPFVHTPKARCLVAIEANHESGDEIELPAEMREPNERTHPPNDALDSEQANHFTEHRHLVDIQPQNVVPEIFGDKKEIARATTKIENT